MWNVTKYFVNKRKFISFQNMISDGKVKFLWRSALKKIRLEVSYFEHPKCIWKL